MSGVKEMRKVGEFDVVPRLLRDRAGSPVATGMCQEDGRSRRHANWPAAACRGRLQRATPLQPLRSQYRDGNLQELSLHVSWLPPIPLTRNFSRWEPAQDPWALPNSDLTLHNRLNVSHQTWRCDNSGRPLPLRPGPLHLLVARGVRAHNPLMPAIPYTITIHHTPHAFQT